MIPFLWKWEGTKFENDPDDPGGATKFGIDQRSFPGEDIRKLDAERAELIYWTVYWNGAKDMKSPPSPLICENLAPGLGEVHFNARVNCGKGRAQKFLALAASSPKQYLAEQAAFYRRLAAARPKSQKYLQGWLNRVNDLTKFLNL